MNRGGFFGKLLPAIFVAAVFVTQANPLLSLRSSTTWAGEKRT